MRSQIKRVRQPLPVEPGISGGDFVSTLLERTSLKDVPLKERRKEARKPLYLVRYE